MFGDPPPNLQQSLPNRVSARVTCSSVQGLVTLCALHEPVVRLSPLRRVLERTNRIAYSLCDAHLCIGVLTLGIGLSHLSPEVIAHEFASLVSALFSM